MFFCTNGQLTPPPHLQYSSVRVVYRSLVAVVPNAPFAPQVAIHLQTQCQAFINPIPSISLLPFLSLHSASPSPKPLLSLTHPAPSQKKELPTHQSQQPPRRITRLRPNTQPILRPHRIKLDILKRFSLSFLWRLGNWIVCS